MVCDLPVILFFVIFDQTSSSSQCPDATWFYENSEREMIMKCAHCYIVDSPTTTQTQRWEKINHSTFRGRVLLGNTLILSGDWLLQVSWLSAVIFSIMLCFVYMCCQFYTKDEYIPRGTPLTN